MFKIRALHSYTDHPIICYFNLLEIRIPKKFFVCIFILISFQSYQMYSGNFKLDPARCIPMDILACTDCVRSIAGNISYTDIFSSSNLKKYSYFLTFYSVYQKSVV